jgi:serine/threonine protein kinase
MINPGTILQERYLIEKQIGEGGMGAVYLATDQRFDNFVAIKETFYKDDELGEAFEREARILNGLLHPALPHVSDYFTEGDEHFLVMQFIEGEDVSDILKREGAFPVNDVLRWFETLLDALEYLHSQEPPIIHRDLKPSNLKLTSRGDVFLLDFGLAKLKKDNTLSERSVFGYSRRYSPLEQIQGVGTDARSDLFALAATVFHLFTGKPPIDAIARASAIVAGKPDPLVPASEENEEVPVSVANILNTALALNAENRFASAGAMRQALKHAVQETSPENIETVSAVSPVIEATETKVITPAENEDFPALVAFAAESHEASAESTESADLEIEDSASIEVPIIMPATTNHLSKIGTGDIPTQVAPRRRQPRLPVFALIALLAFIAAASAIFVFKSRKSAEPAPVATETSETEANSAEPSAVPPAEEQVKISETLAKEENAKVKTNSISAKKPAAETEVEKAAVVEESTHAAPETKSAKTATRRQSAKAKIPDIDTRARVVENEPVPDIESVFTGRPSWERRRSNRRQRIEEMSEDEWREMRRRRRQQRRQNSYPIPF